jgi:hypothetical protein
LLTTRRKVQSADLAAPTAAELARIADMAVWFLDTAGAAFLERHCVIREALNGKDALIFDHDAERLCRAFERLMRQANLSKNP